MASLNKVMLIATLGKDPEIRYTTEIVADKMQMLGNRNGSGTSGGGNGGAGGLGEPGGSHNDMPHVNPDDDDFPF